MPRLLDSHGFTKNKWCRGPVTGVDKQRQTAPGQIERMLDLQLEITDQLEAVSQPLGIKPVLQAIKQQRPERVVAATRVAAGQNNDLRLQQLRGHY